MSEIMRPLPFGKLMRWALAEYSHENSMFGIPKEKFYSKAIASCDIFGVPLSTPVGPAAGPHSQLAQNIIAAWLCGSRFIELKTVQKMDGDVMRACVPRPCINAEDEGYNVEWSTELTVREAYEEYVKAWITIHVLTKNFAVSGGSNVVFNMSVGYDYDGIKAGKVNTYIDSMIDASRSDVFKNSIAWLHENSYYFQNLSHTDILAIPSHVSGSVTLSTLHGCPVQEIERIANYLLCEKNLHTYIKCNPTLLGYKTARTLLDDLGYGYISFDEYHFKSDLQYADATVMLQKLLATAKTQNLTFGVKVTNTFPVQITGGILPGDEMYMSGKPLFALSIKVAEKLSNHFGGKLPISYSGGADAFNIKEIYETGIYPITVATTLLKPGGYTRISQLADILTDVKTPECGIIDTEKLSALAKNVVDMPFYRKNNNLKARHKNETPLGLYDCFIAPCKENGCPIKQQIPAYLKYVSEEKYKEAFEVIAIDNALPSITGEICNHMCQNACTRLDYEQSLNIRNAKLLAAGKAQEEYVSTLLPSTIKTSKTAVVIGAGPAGIAAAVFLRRAGMAVTVYEKRDKPFGIVEYVIPAFRISTNALKQDYELAKAIGVQFVFGSKKTNVQELISLHDYVIIATGAWQEADRPATEGKDKLLDALAFLEESKTNNCNVNLGAHVAVLGGGDVAMDCARAAKRAPNVKEVTIVYRRTKEYMPASGEEVELTLADGVNIVELCSPLSYNNELLTCEMMNLGDLGSDGRRTVRGTGEHTQMQFNSVISAVGSKVDTSIFELAKLNTDKDGLPILADSCQSSIDGVYVVGDCKGGPATVVRAIADAKLAAVDICDKNSLEHGFYTVSLKQNESDLCARRGVLAQGNYTAEDAARCLGCDSVCEICCEVCPNRANVRIAVPGMKNPAQILHIDDLCNECGNCASFCPHTGEPYRNKLTLFSREEDFTNSENCGFFKKSGEGYLIRLENGSVISGKLNDKRIPAPMANFITAIQNNYPYLK